MASRKSHSRPMLQSGEESLLPGDKPCSSKLKQAEAEKGDGKKETDKATQTSGRCKGETAKAMQDNKSHSTIRSFGMP